MKFQIAIFLSLSLLANEGKVINDFSRLNATTVTDIAYPSTVAEIQQTLLLAKWQNKCISIAGKRHSQGGHAFCPDAIVIDICNFNKIIKLDIENKIITVQTGATWEQIQNYINPYGLAVKVMQTAEIFTVGGSLSVNAHGRDPRYGPLIQTIKAVRILLASGDIVEASREKNYDLFKLAIGGYGLFGVILEADIELTDNAVYCKCAQIIRVAEYAQFIDEKVLPDNTVGMHYGILSTSPYNFLKEMVIVNYHELPIDQLSKRRYRQANRLHKGGNMQLSKTMVVLQRAVPFAHLVDWPAIVVREKMPEITCRNNAMRHPTEFLEYEEPTYAYALCSYFIPVTSFVDFMEYLRSTCKSYNIEPFAVLTRYIRKDAESFLSYTDQDRIEVVILITYHYSDYKVEALRSWVQSNINYLIACGGMYYLPCSLYPTYQQITTAYPQLAQFFAKKREYDPCEVFVNCFYRKYAPLTILMPQALPYKALVSSGSYPT